MSPFVLCDECKKTPVEVPAGTEAARALSGITLVCAECAGKHPTEAQGMGPAALAPSPGPLRVNLGAGPHPTPGFVNVDFVRLPGIDLVCDLDHDPFPFADATVDFILMSEAFEHFAHRDHLLRELDRVLKKGGRVEIRGRYGWGNRDPFHLSPLTKRGIRYLTNGYIGHFKLLEKPRYKNLGGFPWYHWRKYLHREPPCLPGVMTGIEVIIVLEKEA